MQKNGVLRSLISLAVMLCALLITPAHAVIVYLGATSGANNALPTDMTPGSLTINTPAGVVPGDALIASIAARPSNMVVTRPAGWNPMTITQQAAGGPSTLPGGMTLLTYYHVVGFAEPASHTWTFANTAGSGASYGGSAVGGILGFSGIDTSTGNPIDVWSARLTASGLTHATNSINTTMPNTMIVSSISYLSGSSFGAPSGIASIVERLDQRAPVVANAVGTTIQMSTVPQAAIGASGATSATAAADADTGVGHLMALKPAAIDPSLAMSRSGPLIPGLTASYTMTVTNNGFNPEPGPLTIVNTLPAGLSFNSFSGAGWGCSAVGQVVTCTKAGALAGGASAVPLVVTVNVSAGSAGIVTNTATVSGTGGDGNNYNNTATDSYNIQADPAISMTRNTALDPGQNATYTLDVVNNGPLAEAGPITVTDTLPAGLTYSSFSGAGWACSAAGQVVTCTRAGSLARLATSSVTLTVAVAATATGSKTNTATVAGSSADNTPGNNSASDTYTIIADLAIAKVRNTLLNPGQSANYTLTVTNNGPSGDAGTITVTDTLPAGLAYVSAVGTGWACGAVGQVITCTRGGTLASGTSAPGILVTVNVAAAATGAKVNTASVASSVPARDTTAANNTATDSFTIAADLAIAISLPGAIIPGSNAAYSVFVSNGGPVDEPGPITVSTTLQTGLSYVSGTGAGWSCGAVGQVVTCTRAGSLAAGATASTLVLTVAVAGTVAGAVSTTVSVAGTAGLDNNLANNTATDSYTFATYAYYAMDEAPAGWAANVPDSSGNGRNGTVLSTSAPSGYPPTSPIPGSALSGNPGTCGVGNFFLGGGGVNTNIDVNSIGNAGTIAFWYNGILAWNSANDQMLLDASNEFGNGGADKHFYLVKESGGRLRFAFEDNSDNDDEARTATSYTFAANTWHHIAVTWNMGSVARIYLDGVQVATSGATAGTLGDMATLYIGARRNASIAGTPGNYTANSANGYIDEVRIYNSEVNATGILAIKNLRHSCGPQVNHYELEMSPSSLSCTATDVTVTACADTSSPCTNPATSVGGDTANLATSAGTIVSSPVTFNAFGVATATLNYPAATEGAVATVTLSGESTAATSPRKCCQNGVCSVANSCSTTFKTTGFIISDTAAGGSFTIPTQVAGTTSPTYYIRAVTSAPPATAKACEAALGPGASTVNFAYECNNPTSCSAGNLMSINGGSSTPITGNSNGSVSTYTPVNLTFDANGSAPFTFNYGDVGRVKLWASKPPSGTLVSTLAGSSNAFVVRPDHFNISNVIRTSDSFANPAAASATDPVFVRAGDPFTATVSSRSSTNAITPNYGKETTPQGVRLVPSLVLPVGGVAPALTGATAGNGVIAGTEFGATGQVASDANGVATVTDLGWDEVGIITLGAIIVSPDNAGANTYLGAGAAPSATTGTIGNIGRFYPHHFAVLAAPVTNRADLICSDTFTYFGEQLNVSFSLSAQSLTGDNLLNYRDNFARLTPTFATMQLGAVDRTTVLPAPATAPPNFLNPPTRLIGTGVPAVSCAVPPCFSVSQVAPPASYGKADITVPFKFTRSGTAEGPYTAVDIGINPVDLDGVTVIYDLDTATAGGVTFNKGLVGTATLRHGRMLIPNTYGSHSFALPVNVTAQYWDGRSFVANALDNCTSLAAGNFTVGGGTGDPITTTVVGGTAIASGLGRITLSKPTSAATSKGSRDLTSIIPYLPGVGRETFGVYKAGPVIYTREMY
ncbi:hypothetical protein BH11PSE11_BH11PSE11_11360 [soil metagenome]